MALWGEFFIYLFLKSWCGNVPSLLGSVQITKAALSLKMTTFAGELCHLTIPFSFIKVNTESSTAKSHLHHPQKAGNMVKPLTHSDPIALPEIR